MAEFKYNQPRSQTKKVKVKPLKKSLLRKGLAKLGISPTDSSYVPELTTEAGPPEKKSNPVKDAHDSFKKRRRKKRKKQREAERKAKQEAEKKKLEELKKTELNTSELEADEPVQDTGVKLGEDDPEDETPTSVSDITTSTGSTVGTTNVTPSSIYTADPEDAISDQERLAQEELKRQRIKRARQKQSLIRRRIERTSEVGSGRRVLSGTERELNIQTRQAGTGRRRGAGRRSLITGSTGGIGYYSRFL